MFFETYTDEIFIYKFAEVLKIVYSQELNKLSKILQWSN